MGNLADHQELQSILGAGVAGEVGEPRVDNLRSPFSGEIAAQVDVQLAGDSQVIGGPGVTK
jgi:hypothetical protein